MLLSLWQQCRTKFRPFDKFETNWTCSNCFDFVERIVRLVAFDNVASTLLLVWMGLNWNYYSRGNPGYHFHPTLGACASICRQRLIRHHWKSIADVPPFWFWTTALEPSRYPVWVNFIDIKLDPIHAVTVQPCQTPFLSTCSTGDPSAARLPPSTTESSPIACTFAQSLRRGMTLWTALIWWRAHRQHRESTSRTESTLLLSTRTNHGGLCLFYASFLSAREVPLPVNRSGMEALTVYYLL